MSASEVKAKVKYALAWLEKRGTQRNREGMARFGIVTDKVFGVSMATMQSLAKSLGRNHDLGVALWDTGWYEARILCSFVAEPAKLTPAQMNRWARDFDNWAICDTTCFHLFDKTPHAWAMIEKWGKREDEFVKRAAFALIASVGVHDKKLDDAPFLGVLPLIERCATDDRNYVKKGVSWALRVIGHRNPRLMDAAVALATKLAASPNAASRWIGRDALRDLAKARARWEAKSAKPLASTRKAR
jgi:3-methyladenine DNA glycosylase AlkD